MAGSAARVASLSIPVDILLVCTANRCRSPMAEALLRRQLDQQRPGLARVASAGFLPSGVPAMDYAVDALAAVGLDISGHRSRQVTQDLIDRSDLIVAMTRQHVVELTLLAPDGWPRTYQVEDLLRRAGGLGVRPPGQPFREWLAVLGAGRTRSTVLEASVNDDVADPVGLPRPAYDRARDLLEDRMTRLAALL